MFCPNCGVEIHPEASYCAKCRKHVAYITAQLEPESEEVFINPISHFSLPDEASISETAAAENLTEASAMESTQQIPEPENKPGFYCNYCANFIYPEDNYCYKCGQKTRKEYYKTETTSTPSPISKKKLYIILGVVFGVALAIGFGYYLTLL